ncbi:MAG: hypothetical protein IJJ10_05935 [Bacillus sp. (in: Bacteria)]|uniref:hypothetical protein n=1 Tax=Niallia sp. FSL W8-1348 TaxID=2954656 RepID=UPI0030F78F56|nr:hypothetical protein [Bacillus sp. (in: firmicutes)]
MSLYILALLSLVIVVPVMYLLPLGLSNRGKFITIGLALCVSAIGILSRELFPIWQSILIMLLFLIIASYFLMKNWSKVLFELSEEVAESVTENVQETIEVKDSKATTNSVIEEEDIITYVSNINSEEILINEENVTLDKTVDSLDVELDLDVIEKLELTEQEEVIYPSVEEQEILDKELDDEAVEKSYLAEIEKMLDEDASPVIDLIEDRKEDEIEEIPFPIYEESEVAVSSEKNEQEQHLDDLSLDVLAEVDIEDEKILEQENIEELQDFSAKEMLDEVAEITIEEDQANPIESDGHEKENEVSGLAYKIINNTLSQLEMMKHSMDKEKFEIVLKQCLKESMPLNEYFAFSTLLIDIYVQNNENDKLKNLLYILHDKFAEQPIVLEQIKFMAEKYLNE